MLIALKRFSETVSFIGYIREPVAFARSSFQQQIKFDFKSFDSVIHNFFIIPLSISWNLVGKENVHALAFDRDLFPGGDVVRHFLTVLE